jgi:hypothetical protein
MQRNQLVQKELPMIRCRTLSSNDKVWPGEEMSSHDIDICVYFAQGLFELFNHMNSFFCWRVEDGALDVNIASEGGEICELGE